MEITVTIKKNDVYGLIEGLTANIGKKNPDVGFEAMWASQGDEATLDIFWDEARNDLEATVQHWLEDASIDRNDATGDEQYGLTLKINSDWPKDKLTNLLEKSVTQYLVHATLAGWLSIMPKLNVDADYGVMATNDLGNVVALLLRRKIEVTAEERAADEEDAEEYEHDADERATDEEYAEEYGYDADERAADDATADEDAAKRDVTERAGDDAEADAEATARTMAARTRDTEGVGDDAGNSRTVDRHNNRDRVRQCIPHETLDMSGGYSINHINRIRHGKEEHKDHHKPW